MKSERKKHTVNAMHWTVQLSDQANCFTI